MDKNKFWLGGRLFNTASPSLGTPTQRKARPQDGRPNATQGMSASWAPQRNARHVCKLGAPTHVRKANARHVRTSASWAPQRNARHVRKMVAQTQNSSATKTSTQGSTRLKDSWRMDKNKFWLGGRLFNTASPRLGAPTQCKACPQDGCPNATQGTSCKLGAPTHVRNANARHVPMQGMSQTTRPQVGAPQRNARHVRKMVAQTQNSSATKTSTQGSTRLKDELEDG
jgi:hypothetical protein